MTDDIYITVSLEVDEDEPIADILYRGVQWASLKLGGGKGVLTLYAGDGGFALPLEAALASVEEAQERLRKLGCHSRTLAHGSDAAARGRNFPQSHPSR